MAATVTASIASLILTLDDPGRDDLSGVIVWASTANGFTPGAGNVVYRGNSLTITIANLTPLTTYYLRYAYVSVIEPGNYEISAQLSGVPSKIDGSVIVDGTVSAAQIKADALRGKLLAGNVLLDSGSIVTADVAKPTNVVTTTTVQLVDTADFPSKGAAIVFGRSTTFASRPILFRYTGKTGTSLTGVSGLQDRVLPGDSVVPMPFPSFEITASTDPIRPKWSGTDAFTFRQGGGSALVVPVSAETDLLPAEIITYTAGQTYSSILGQYLSTLSGVSGLSSFAADERSARIIIDLTESITTTVAANGLYSSLTLDATTDMLNPKGGRLLIADFSSETAYVTVVSYTAFSGTTVTLGTSTGVVLNPGTHYLVPLFSYSSEGTDDAAVQNLSSMDLGFWSLQKLGMLEPWQKNSLAETLIEARSGNALTLLPSKKTGAQDAAALRISDPERVPHIELIPNVFADLGGGDPGFFSFGASFVYDGTDGRNVLISYDAIVDEFVQYQPISSVMRFSGYDVADVISISYNAATYTFSFNYDGGSANAKLSAAGLKLSDNLTLTRGTATQATSRTTGVTIDQPAGSITLVSAAGSTTWTTLTVANNKVAANDIVSVSQQSGADLYEIHVTNVAAGSFKVSFRTTGGTTTEQPVFNFAVIKAA